MGIRYKRLDRLFRVFLAVVALGAILAAGSRFWNEGAFHSLESRYRELVEIAGRWLVEALWNQVQPGMGSRESTGSTGRGAAYEMDPSYRKYREAERFYQEHEYLAWYGDEETGLDAGVYAEEISEERVYAGEIPGAGTYAGGLPEDGKDGQAEGGADARAALQTLAGVLDRPVVGSTYVLEQLMDYDFLMSRFYSVHTSTTAGRELMDAKELLGTDLSMEKDSSVPQILIYHTHSQEAYADSGPGQTVVGVGEALARLLEAKGYGVYHDTSVYDLKDGKLDRSRAYNYALEGIGKILEENPSIQVILDIHRDGVAESLHLAANIDGKDTARIMFFNGLSQTPEGPIEYLKNPYREQNLAFSLQLQLGAEAYFPGFTRKIYLKGLRYNEHLRPRSSLIEVGAQTNTYEEAVNAMGPLAELLDMVLQGKQKNSIIQ